MHPKVAQALEEIDAAVFSGDTFYDPDPRALLLYYMERWIVEMESYPGDGECL